MIPLGEIPDRKPVKKRDCPFFALVLAMDLDLARRVEGEVRSRGGLDIPPPVDGLTRIFGFRTTLHRDLVIARVRQMFGADSIEAV